jgi:hypothetical protein
METSIGFGTLFATTQVRINTKNLYIMKKFYLYIIIAIALSSCAIGNFSTSNVYEDDIYYNPSEKPLSIKEVEKQLEIYTNNEIKPETKKSLEEKAQKIIRDDRRAYPDFTNNEINNPEIESVRYIRNQETGAQDTIIELMNSGFWMNGFKGTDSDLADAMRKISQYPNGFAYFGNASEIANNIAYDSNWNVYTRDGKYWWFPTFSNTGYYTRMAFSTYPRYYEINTWNNIGYDSWAFDRQYNNYFAWGRYNRHNYFHYYGGYNSYWDNYYGGFYNYNYYDYYNPYYYGNRYSRYNNLSKRQRLINQRGHSKIRSSRQTMRPNRTNFSPTGKNNTRVTRSNTNTRRSKVNYNKAARRNTNYNRSTKRKTINYNKKSSTTRPSYNSSSSSSSKRSSSSSRSSKSSSSKSRGRVNRR